MPKTKQTLPSFNPADLASQEGLLNFLKKQTFADLYVCLPAVILSFDRLSNRASVQPAIHAVSTDEEQIPMPSVSNIPVHTPGGGGFAASFPLTAGDTGWLITADKDISLFKQHLSLVPPNTYRRHQLEDAFFIPDVFQKISVGSEDSARAVWQTISGDTKITMGPSDVRIKAASVTIDGDVTLNGTLSASGIIRSAVNIIGAAISLIAHVHGGVQNGPGTTGGPQ